MKITFIRPNMTSYKSKDAMQPLIFAILSAHTPDEFEKVFYDDRIEEIPFDEPTDLVAMSVETFTANRAYFIADQYQSRSIPVVMGGFHPSAEPEEVLKHATTVVIGDAENSWPDLLRDFQTGELKSVYKSTTQPILKTKFKRDIFNNKKYFPVNLIQWGRGCCFNCDFCSIKAFYGQTQSFRPVEDVIAEIKNLDDKPVFFVDDNLYHNRKDFRYLLHALSGLGKKWACQITINVTQDEELMNLLEQSGCMLALIGIESLIEENLIQMKKSSNLKIKDYDEAIRCFENHGIMIYGTFVFGYDNDHVKNFDEAVEYAISRRFSIANFNPLYPMPGTQLYKTLLEENRLLHPRWWNENNFYYGKTIFKPKNMLAKELEQGCYDAKRKFNTWYSILKRLCNIQNNMKSFRNLYLYLLLNIVNKIEITKKQGKILGK